MDLVPRLDRLQQRHPVLGFPLAVAYKTVDDSGVHLAALIAFYGLVSLFPLLLLATAVLGLVLVGDPTLQQEVLDTALEQIPVVGPQLQDNPETFGGGTTGVVVGLVGALYGALGVSLAVQNALNTVWRVPRDRRPNPLLGRLRGLLLLATVGLAVVATTALTAVGRAAEALGPVSGVGVVLGVVVLNTGVAVVGMRVATARALGVRDVLPGAVVVALGWQLLQVVGAPYVARVVSRADEASAVLAFVLGVLAFLLLAGLLLVVAAQLDAVRVLGLWPRALLAPVTDDAPLTGADERAYAGQAQAQRAKGFERIDVDFGQEDQD